MHALWACSGGAPQVANNVYLSSERGLLKSTITLGSLMLSYLSILVVMK